MSKVCMYFSCVENLLIFTFLCDLNRAQKIEGTAQKFIIKINNKRKSLRVSAAYLFHVKLNFRKNIQ